MSNRGINTNVSGGHVQIGNISQGDNNKVIARIEPSVLEASFAGLFNQLSATTHSNATEVAELRDELTQLQLSLQHSEPTRESLIDKAHRLYEKYGWATGLLKGLFAHLIPL